MAFQELQWDTRDSRDAREPRPALGAVPAAAGVGPGGVLGIPIPPLFEPLPCSALHGLLGAVLDELDHGVLICAPNGRLLAYNRCARHALFSHPHVVVQDQVLGLRHGDPQALPQALRQASQGRRTLLPLSQGDARQYLACTPLGDQAQVLVMMGREQPYSPLAFEMFCAQHHLTHAERRVLNALMAGLRPADMATDFGVALSTVRTQVAHIRSKLGADRIESLLQMVAGLPPMASLLGTGSH
jgi:DNA-binding CsgD family transcriptional regulator